MSLARLSARNRFDRALYVAITPYLTALALVFAVLPLLWPQAFGLDLRTRLIPYFLMVALNAAFLFALRRYSIPLWIDRVRIALTMVLALLVFYWVNPTRSLLWVSLLLPALSQVPTLGVRHEGRWRFAALAVVVVGIYVLHFPFWQGNEARIRWAVVSVAQIITLLTVAGIAWGARHHHHEHRRGQATYIGWVPQSERIDLRFLVAEALAKLEPVLAARRVRHELKVPDMAVPVRGAPADLRHMVFHLLSAFAGAKTLKIELARRGELAVLRANGLTVTFPLASEAARRRAA
jgi:hypothetical protein